jgi:hypothetical protein
MSLAMTTTALNELPSLSKLGKLSICTSEKEMKDARNKSKQKLWYQNAPISQNHTIPTYRQRGRLSPLSHLMRGQHPTTRNLFSVRCDGWMCQIGDSIDFHEREISLTSQAIAKLLIIAQHGLKSRCRSIIETPQVHPDQFRLQKVNRNKTVPGFGYSIVAVLS